MSYTGAGYYDDSCAMYSPDGKIFQIDYAAKAVEQSGLAMGIHCFDGVVLGVEKNFFASMLIPDSIQRIYAVDKHIGMVLSGLSFDGRQLCNQVRKECKEYRDFYGVPIIGSALASKIGLHLHSHTTDWSTRPFGCSIALASFDHDGPSLYMLEPSGIYYKYRGTAIGQHSSSARAEIEKIEFKTISTDIALKEMARIFIRLRDDFSIKPTDIASMKSYSDLLRQQMKIEFDFAVINKDSYKKISDNVKEQILGHAIQYRLQEEMMEEKE